MDLGQNLPYKASSKIFLLLDLNQKLCPPDPSFAFASPTEISKIGSPPYFVDTPIDL